MPFSEERTPDNHQTQEEAHDTVESTQPEAAEHTSEALPPNEDPSPDETSETLPAQPKESEQSPEERPLTRREILEQESGIGLWLTLAIGAAVLLLLLLLPWANIYYLNPMQKLILGADNSVVLAQDQVVHIGIPGFELLTLNFWPLLVLTLLTALLLGVVIYWRQHKFAQPRLAWLILALGLIVGVGFPLELQHLLVSSQRVEWSNLSGTIEDNHKSRVFATGESVGLCTPKAPNDHTCDKYYAQGVILSASIDWTQITSEGHPVVLVQGHADGLRASATSPDVTTSGEATGTFGNLGTSFGYWGSWLFSLWILLNALLLLRRLLRARRA